MKTNEIRKTYQNHNFGEPHEPNQIHKLIKIRRAPNPKFFNYTI